MSKSRVLVHVRKSDSHVDAFHGAILSSCRPERVISKFSVAFIELVNTGTIAFNLPNKLMMCSISFVNSEGNFQVITNV